MEWMITVSFWSQERQGRLGWQVRSLICWLLMDTLGALDLLWQREQAEQEHEQTCIRRLSRHLYDHDHFSSQQA
jgi:hypothetical protein